MSKPIYHVKVYVGPTSSTGKGMTRDDASAAVSVLDEMFTGLGLQASALIVVKMEDVDAAKEEINQCKTNSSPANYLPS